MLQLSVLVSGIHQRVSAIDVKGGSGPRERSKKPLSRAELNSSPSDGTDILDEGPSSMALEFSDHSPNRATRLLRI